MHILIHNIIRSEFCYWKSIKCFCVTSKWNNCWYIKIFSLKREIRINVMHSSSDSLVQFFLKYFWIFFLHSLEHNCEKSTWILEFSKFQNLRHQCWHLPNVNNQPYFNKIASNGWFLLRCKSGHILSFESLLSKQNILSRH